MDRGFYSESAQTLVALRDVANAVRPTGMVKCSGCARGRGVSRSCPNGVAKPKRVSVSSRTCSSARRCWRRATRIKCGKLLGNSVMPQQKAFCYRVGWSQGQARCEAYWQPSVSHPRSSNRTCGFPASGFPTGFISQHTTEAPGGHDEAGLLPSRHAQLDLRSGEFPAL